jgi:hypothetical protein
MFRGPYYFCFKSGYAFRAKTFRVRIITTNNITLIPRGLQNQNQYPVFVRDVINSLALELDIYSLAQHLCKM